MGIELAAIDFDDCGFGFYAYDLVIPLISTEYILGRKRKNEIPKFKEALLRGYMTHAKWDKHDESILPHLMNARRLLMLGWLNSRSDNPRLQGKLRQSAKKAIKHLKKTYTFL